MSVSSPSITPADASAASAVLPRSTGGYSRENAERFVWSSVSGNLNPERVAHLEAFVVGKTVLDAGCGGGAFVDFLSRQSLDVTGVDLHTEFLSIVEERQYQGRFVQGDIIALPFANKSFDFTYCFDVLEHVDDERAIQELARVTRQRILLAVPRENVELAQYNLTFLPYQDTTHLRYYTEESLTRLANSVSARNVQIFPELNVSLGELVRTFTRLDEEKLRQRVSALLNNIGPGAVADFNRSESRADQNTLLGQTIPPPFPVQGVRDRMRAWAVGDPHVQKHFQNAFQSATTTFADQQMKQMEASVEASAAHIANALTEQIYQTILFEATFPDIPTGLVAVIDL